MNWGFSTPDFGVAAICHRRQDIVAFTKGLDAFPIVNFSAYSGLSHSDTLELAPLNSCNWADHLLKQGRLTNYTVVYPEWRKQWPERPDGKIPKGVGQVLYGACSKHKVLSRSRRRGAFAGPIADE